MLCSRKNRSFLNQFYYSFYPLPSDILAILRKKTGQDVGKAGTDSFSLEEAYTHFLNFKNPKTDVR